jgi:DNA-binding SARP family transcriptional activator
MPQAPNGGVALVLLGAARARLGTRIVELPERLVVLLTLLALGGPLERSRAAAWLYPAADTAAALRNLRQTLHQQQDLLTPLVAVGQEHLALRETVLLDVRELLKQRAACVTDPTPALEPLLGERRFPDRPEFQSWLDLERTHLRTVQLDRLAALASVCEHDGQLARALQLAQRLLAEQPVSEHVHRRVMRLHYLRGDRAAALDAFDQCERVLKDELSVRPADETLDLLRMIGTAAVPVAPSGGGRCPAPLALRRPPRCVGRDTEREALTSAWAGGLAFLVQGEAGIGKSRLLAEHVAGHADALLVRARHGDARRPYATLARLLDGLPGRMDLAVEHSEVLAVLCGGADQIGVPEKHATTSSIRAAVLAALDQAQVHPVLDDLHLADTATLEMLAWLTGEGAERQTRWGFAARPHDQPALLELRRLLEDRGRLRLCRLQPFDPSQVAELLASLQLPRGRVADLAPTLARRAGGNPMFTLELLKGWFYEADATDPASLPVPHSIALLLDQQIAACSPRAALIVRLAALAATDFSIELAEATLGQTALALADAWHEVEDRQLMRNGLFAHDLVQEAAARSVPPDIAAATHARIAAWLTAQAGPGASIAMHWLAAGRDALAVDPLVQAARQAIAAGRIGEAGQHYQQAAQILQRQGDGDAAYDRYIDACEMYTNAAATADFDAAALQVQALARTPLQRVRARFIDALGLHLRGDVVGSAALWPPLLDEAIVVGDRRVEAECRFELSRLQLLDGRSREFLRMMASAADIFRELGLVSREHVARTAMARLVVTAGLDPPTRPMPLAALDSPRIDQLDGLERRARAPVDWTDPARIAADAGDFGRALELVEAAFDELVLPEIPPSERCVGAAKALCVLTDLGQHGLALDLLRRFDARQDAYRGEWHHQVQAERAVMWAALGRPEQGLQVARQVEASAVRSHRVRHRLALLAVALRPGQAGASYHRDEESLPLLLRSALALLPGEPAALALEEIAHLEARMQGRGFDAWRPALHALKAQCLAELGDDAQAHWADSAEQALAQLALPATVAPACICLYRARQGRGDGAGAARIARWGHDWLTGVALQRVPPLFHDSFLHRNPVHAQLLGLAAAG